MPQVFRNGSRSPPDLNVSTPVSHRLTTIIVRVSITHLNHTFATNKDADVTFVVSYARIPVSITTHFDIRSSTGFEGETQWLCRGKPSGWVCAWSLPRLVPGHRVRVPHKVRIRHR